MSLPNHPPHVSLSAEELERMEPITRPRFTVLDPSLSRLYRVMVLPDRERNANQVRKSLRRKNARARGVRARASYRERQAGARAAKAQRERGRNLRMLTREEHARLP